MQEGAGPRLELSLPADASSVPAARHALRGWLDAAGRPDLLQDAELAVTELVTNALVHTATVVGLRGEVDATTTPATVRVEVSDGSPHLPRLRETGSSSGTGRGLRLLDRVVTRWGAERSSGAEGDGKRVWFEIGPERSGSDRGEGLADDGGPEVAGTSLVITLLDVPLLLLTAWKEHVSALLREHLLVQLQGDDVEAALVRHAAAGEVLALLDEQWPEPTRHLDPDALMAASVEPHVTIPRMRLRLPRGAERSFAVLEEVIEEALVLADRGELLTAPTQPEMRAMRHWLVAEVMRQAAGEAPVPHVFGSDELTGPPLDLGWDHRLVDDADEACLAADSENRIVAASDAALRFLGWGRELVGQRLLRIIPTRYHQAHLVGFSLHLVNDRGPLIGVPVVVPIRCADDRERLAELLIKTEHGGLAGAVYVAELRPLSSS